MHRKYSTKSGIVRVKEKSMAKTKFHLKHPTKQLVESSVLHVLDSLEILAFRIQISG
jgi:hypothetical protein